jgi:Rieske Fe-S protein
MDVHLDSRKPVEGAPDRSSPDAACIPCRLRQVQSARGKSLSKPDARSGLKRLQLVIGVSFLLSTVSGGYLLATDGSLWNLAISHAFGLIIIVTIDAILGILNLLGRRNVYLPSIAAATLGFLLQAGDIVTAPQYNMTIPYFASYLFGLWAYDLLLALQLAVIATGVFGSSYARYLARVRKGRGRKELSYTKRDFLKSFVAFAALIGGAVVAGSVKLPPPQQQTTTQTSQSNLPSGAIANTNQLQAGSPVYFEYPSGYPNILLKNSDGTLTALSMLCTHVCCQCSYEPSSNVIFCPCHGSVFDATGKVVRGPAQIPLPSIELTVDSSGFVYAKALNGRGPCLP